MKKQEQLNLFKSPQSVYAPYLIEQDKEGKWLLKIGRWSNSQYGGIKHWTLVGTYNTLDELLRMHAEQGPEVGTTREDTIVKTGRS